MKIQRTSYPSIALWFILAVMLANMVAYHNWTRSKPNERGVIKWDVISYYAYLPATFIYGDVKLGFLDDKSFNNDSKFWPYRLDNGNLLIQTSMGLSILYSPFFFAAHALAPLFKQAPDGYSSIYQLFLALSSLFYVMMGLLILKRLLLRYFTHAGTAITLLLVGLGTNLFFYTVHFGPMSHGYNFALITLFLALIIRWYEKPVMKTTILLGLVYGLIVLVRPSNIIAGTLLLLWGVTGWASFRERMGFLVKNYLHLVVMLLFFILPWIPQFLYWKAVTGSFVFNSYGPSGSSFYLGSPHIFDVLFSYRKGWYLYTPVMLVATAGLFVLKGEARKGRFGITLYLILQIYLLASWWSWWNGGSFGHRSFIDIYGIMAIPLAAMMDTALRQRRKVAVAAMALMAFLLYMNQFQTFQYNKGYIHHTGMTKKAYWLNFLAFRGDGSCWNMLSLPDAELARLGIYYDYYTGTDNTPLKEMEEDEGMALVREEIKGDKKLQRQIYRHSKRTGQTPGEVQEMVVERVYEYKIANQTPS